MFCDDTNSLIASKQKKNIIYKIRGYDYALSFIIFKFCKISIFYGTRRYNVKIIEYCLSHKNENIER